MLNLWWINFWLINRWLLSTLYLQSRRAIGSRVILFDYWIFKVLFCLINILYHLEDPQSYLAPPNHSIALFFWKLKLYKCVINIFHQAYSYPTYNSNSAILLWRPSNYCWSAVFSPLRAVIYYYNLEFSAF